MKTKKLLFYLLAALLGGCVPSLHPLYTEKELIFEEKLLGLWANGESEWYFEKADEEKSYELLVLHDYKTGKFTARLVKIDKMLFLDLFPEEPQLQSNDLYKVHLLPVHTFLKVEQLQPTLKMRMMDPEKIKQTLENKPDLIKHEIVEENRVVLTASPKELQKFMKEHADDEGLFGDPTEFKRLVPQEPNEPDVIKQKLSAEKNVKEK